MKANLNCMRDVLCYIYYNLDDKEKIRFNDISSACGSYTQDELSRTLNRMIKAGMVSVLPLPGKLIINDITVDGITCMRNMME